MKIDVIDLRINNLSSISRAFQLSAVPGDVGIVDDPRQLRPNSLLVLPGLGSFSSGVSALRRSGFYSAIQEKVSIGNPIVGICLGMQLLGNNSEESEKAIGLGLIDGNTELLTSNRKEKIPHIGWNEASIKNVGSSFNSLNSERDFYFVHSYHLVPKNTSDILTETPFGDGSFTSAVLRGRVLGFQFHPEKSGSVGLKLIKEVIHWAANET